MNRAYLTLVTGLSGLLAATSGSATTLTSDSSVSSSNGGFLCREFNTTGAAVDCTGTQYYVGNDGRFYGIDYSAESSATAGELKTRAALSNRLPVAQSPDPNVEDLTFLYDAFSQSSLKETMTITGGTVGSSGQMKLSYDLDGTNSTPFFDLASPENSPPGFFGGAVSSSRLSANIVGEPSTPASRVAVKDNESINETVELVLDITFGSAFELNVRMSSYVSFIFGDLLDDQPLNAYPLFTVSSEFFSTATLSDIEVLDASGALIDFELVTASGEQTFERFSASYSDDDTPSAVPLPAGMTLMLTGFAAFGLIRGRKVVFYGHKV